MIDISISHGMDESRQLGISNALRRYQEVVEEHNRSTLQMIVECLISTPMPGVSEHAANQVRVRILNRFVRRLHLENLSELQQVFSMELHLDGTSHQPVASRQAWFTAIASQLDIPFPPPDLEYLYSLTSFIHGPGLDWWQITRQTDLLSYSLETPELRVVIPARGLDQDLQLEGLWDEEIAVAVRIGDKNSGTGGSYALYCHKDGVWAWRYAVRDQDWAGDIYDTPEEYLEFYSHFCEPTEQETRDRVQQWASMR